MSDLPIPLHQLRQKLYNVPLLVTPEVAQTVSDVLSRAIMEKISARGDGVREESGDMQVFPPAKADDGSAMVYAPRMSGFVGTVPRDPISGAPAPYKVTGGTAIFRIVGELVNRGEWLNASSGMVAYEAIKHQCSTAETDPLVRNVVIDMRTPGGEAEGCFDCAAAIARLAAVKPVVCFVNGLACSAGYALASACSRIVSIPEGRTGSIGVLMMHVDYSVALQLEGIKPTFLFAGSHKVDGNPYQPLPVDVQARFQAMIDQTYGMFVSTIAAGRKNLSEDDIRATQALVYSGADALSVGLIDAVGTFEDLLIELAQPDAITVDVADTGDDDEESPPDETKTQGASASANSEPLAVATAIGDEDMDTKELKSKLKAAFTFVGLDGVLGETPDEASNATAASAPAPPSMTATAAPQSGADQMVLGASAKTFIRLHYSAPSKAESQATESTPLCGAASSEPSVSSIANVECSDCLRLEIKRRDDEAATVLAAEQARALLTIEASADAFVAKNCAHIGKEATAAYRTRYVAAMKANDTAAIADFEMIAASVGPRRVERVDTKDAPSVDKIAGAAMTSMDVHTEAAARANATGFPMTDQKWLDAYNKASVEIKNASGVLNAATA